MTRPGALVLTPRLPWPQDDGGRIVAWQGLLAAAESHDVALISFAPPGETGPAPPRELIERGVRVTSVPFTPPAAAAAAWRGLFGRWPYSLARYRSRAFDRAVREEIARRRPAVACVHHLHLATYVDALDGVPMVLREHNVEFLWMARYARTAGATPRGAYAAIQAARLRRAESYLCRRSALVMAIQNEEARLLRAMAPGTRVETVPVGVDLAALPERAPADPPVVLLAASFQWPPNVEGALRFLREGWPRLHARVPAAVLRLAGKGPPPALREACDAAGVELAADVPSMAIEYARASLLVVPIWVGAGARVKIVEALASRLPVVSTSIGAEGLDLEAGKHFVAAETAEALADAASDLLREPARRESLAAEGRAVAESRWSLRAVAALQSRLLSSVEAANPMVAPSGERG
ncbi:MAG TPA: glycosyltransferase family 4 protein [Candidatus Eisenbacteria bacterium]|nr:glycosyltransferase family 4 protein [Candidatus Eisenbacteria bacterium]